MREPERDKGRLIHIYLSAGRVAEFLKGRTREDLDSDPILFFAVVKNVEIIGEAAYMLTPAFKAQHPEIPWQDIIHMRHVLVHGYTSISPDDLWLVTQNDVPALKDQIVQLIPPEDLAPYGSR